MKRRLSILFLLLACFATAADEWSLPQTGRRFEFPRDHGSHPDFRIEWWYLTGHLESGEKRYGFQATFFRMGRSPNPQETSRDFGKGTFYLAHMALSDVENRRFLHEERLNRAGWDAHAATDRLDVSNGNWSLRMDGDTLRLEGTIHAEASLALDLKPEKPLVVFGEDGVSRKGAEASAASHYLTFTRLGASGELRVGAETMPVRGEAWMDHEISSSQLDRNQIGWDWTSIQFADGREIMCYVLRNRDGSFSPFSQLYWIDREGKTEHQEIGAFRWEPGGPWKSDATGATYPIQPVVETIDPASGEKRRFRLEPVFDEQELTGGVGGVSYWEGACDVIDEATGKIVGRAYLELTGYADDLGERLR